MFEVLRKELIPTLKTARATTQRLRLWCAACSTGQEPYSIAMMLVDNFPELKDWKADLLATDIAERTLDIARRGVYNQFEVQRGLSIQALLKHFQQLGNQWEISPTIRNFVQFRKFNLLNSFAGLGGPFDIIFIRNVLIYFDDPTKSSILARLRQVIMPDGYLILGGAETVLRLSNHFASVKGAFNYYKPVG
jgi:chemotaxis protein methyltransferase CheR